MFRPSFLEDPLLWRGSLQLAFPLAVKLTVSSQPCMFFQSFKIPPHDCWFCYLRKVLTLKAVGNQQPLRLVSGSVQQAGNRVYLTELCLLSLVSTGRLLCCSVSGGTLPSVVLSSHPSHAQSMKVYLRKVQANTWSLTL